MPWVGPLGSAAIWPVQAGKAVPRPAKGLAHRLPPARRYAPGGLSQSLAAGRVGCPPG